MDADDVMGIEPAELDRVRRVLSELDESDFERIDPPAAIWQGIEASVASMEARRPPSGATPPVELAVEYTIDAGDVLIDVGGGWAGFAEENRAPELAVPPIGRTLWSFIGQESIAELWQLVVQRVRTTERAARIPFRCDAPHARRWFEMSITPGPDGQVRFRSELAFEEPRPPVVLLDPEIDRDVAAEAVPLCSWCGRGQHGTQWFDIEELLRAGRLLERPRMPPVSYGICAACRDEMSAELLVPDRVGQAPA